MSAAQNADSDATDRDVARTAFRLARFKLNLQTMVESPIGNRCLTCGHVKHNELGYCQIGQCACGDGTTVAGLAGILIRDLPQITRPGNPDSHEWLGIDR